MLLVNVSMNCGALEICPLALTGIITISCRHSICDCVVSVWTSEAHQHPSSIIHLTRWLKSSSFIATVAGQAVSEGFIQWRVSVSQNLVLLHEQPFRLEF